MQPVTDTPAELAAYLTSDIAKWSKIVRDGRIKVE
jgi:tripartite-type tricarboxylate transporter receptor subunit TctC